MEIVKPNAFSGSNRTMLQIFGIGPKMNVVCGKCDIGFCGRIDMVDSPALKCPYCDAINKLPLEIHRDK